MALDNTALSTGIPDLDSVLCGLAPGDNLVWQVESIADYAALVAPFAAHAVADGREVVYYRFAGHDPLLSPGPGMVTVTLDPQAGFELFLDTIHHTIQRSGRSARHVFDCMSALAADWCSDQMVGNFFMLTCPFVRNLNALAYFALLRNHHSAYATAPVVETTQILLDVYRYQDALYVHPLKVEGRSSPRTYKLHVWEGDRVRTVSESHVIAEVLNSSRRPTLGLPRQHLGVWTRTFVEAERLLEQHRRDEASDEDAEAMRHRLLRMAIAREGRILRLAARYFNLADLVWVGTRMLGTGLIGGKSVLMLLARAMLHESDPRWENLLETHDSFFIPSDVFYTYLVQNDCWAIRKRQLEALDYIEGSEEAYQRILDGRFPPHIKRRFADMLDYFGQSPVVVRSSSLLEDNFGNSFAGKYQSVFCANQGTRKERLAAFLAAVKKVYASTMSKEALMYRARHGLLGKDEQMALLVQRVSGAQRGPYYFPHISGVGYSFNPYVWNESIDPESGMLRLVFGLGTRAVERWDNDYTRLVALSAPDQRPDDAADDRARHVQQKVDVLDLATDEPVSKSFDELAPLCDDVPLHLFGSRDIKLDRFVRERGMRPPSTPRLTFDALLTKTSFVRDMRAMLEILHHAFEDPVDIEFAANFRADGSYRISLVQCRPLDVKSRRQSVAPPPDIAREDLLFSAHGPVIGQSRSDVVERFIYVVPSAYGRLPIRNQYAVARLIGALNRYQKAAGAAPVTMLLGPGRWGSTTPSLGVPVSFAEIDSVTVLGEIAAMREDLVPDVSFGTHFFNDLVELDILYLALKVTQEDCFLNEAFFENTPNRLTELLPDAADFVNVVRVIDVTQSEGGRSARVWADTLKQNVLGYLA